MSGAGRGVGGARRIRKEGGREEGKEGGSRGDLFAMFGEVYDARGFDIFAQRFILHQIAEKE